MLRPRLKVGGAVCRDDLVGRDYWVSVLPDSEDIPIGGLKCFPLLLIPSLISLDLRPPIGGVGFRDVAVLGAAVPEASVNKDGETPGRENDVRSCLAAAAGANWEIDAKSKPRSMQEGPDLTLGTRVSAAVRTHVVAPGLRARARCRRDFRIASVR